MLRPLLTYAQARRLGVADARRGGRTSRPQRAFVSASLRPYLLAALLDSDPEPPGAGRRRRRPRRARPRRRPARRTSRPRPVRFYPARGVRYESHLAPPPHLVGLRIAALDALLERRGAAVRRGLAPSRSPRRCPTRSCARTASTIEKGGLLDLDETADQLVACGYERVDQVEDRGQFAIRGDILDVYPATEERAVRCELFDVEVERSRWFSTFTQRSLEEAERVEIAPAAELGARAPRAGRDRRRDRGVDERPDVAEVLPVDRFRELLDLVPEDALVAVAAEEELAPGARATTGRTSPRASTTTDAHHLYVPPDALDASARRARARCACRASPQDQPHEFRAQARRHRRALAARGRAGAREARALAATGPSSPGRAAARPSAPQLQPGPRAGRLPRRQAGARASPALHVRPREPARGLPRARS